MIRLRGDRASLLAALLAHWCEQQLALPLTRAKRPRLQTTQNGRGIAVPPPP
jgi:hypothetical protein